MTTVNGAGKIGEIIRITTVAGKLASAEILGQFSAIALVTEVNPRRNQLSLVRAIAKLCSSNWEVSFDGFHVLAIRNTPATRHRRLKLRSSFSFSNPTRHEPVPFEPLVADIERRRKDRQWEKQYLEHTHPEFTVDHAPGHESQPEWEDFMNAEDYLNDEEKFNVTNRSVVGIAISQIDVNPADGLVTENELTDWNLEQAAKEVLHRSMREMETRDKNHDGFVSFAEYEPPSWVKNDNNSFGYDMGWWTEEHFNASDADCVARYFGIFGVSKMVRKNRAEADSDKDGRLSLIEMIENPYVFYSAIFSEAEDDYKYHDEFR
ncbi:reticulocalbin-3-like [Hibiscus syriacus]|uniref:reticulocalbin-3-like n=1 Tax=Hibiscus syriacus TaxID=106335 RepID=UPI001923F725|nr:reticulocalbin-3-like [Hibiscus syriacus]